jgi:hypothetical protein
VLRDHTVERASLFQPTKPVCHFRLRGHAELEKL